MRAAQQGLAADNKQLGVPDFITILASGFLWHGVDGQRCLLQLKPDPLGGTVRIPVRLLGISGIVFGACLLGGLGFLFLVQPEALRDRVGISPDTPSALAEIRSTYGGLHVGIALFLLACAARESMRRTGLLFCGLAFAGAGLARAAGILEFQATDSNQVVIASLEVAFSVITLWLYRRWPAA